MHVHLVWAHPLADSYSATLKDTATASLTAAGHTIDLLDLYAEAFPAAMPRAERARYHEAPGNRAGLEIYVERLQAAQGLVLIFPTWNFGVPAIMKGWLDRVWLPGVAFELGDGLIRPGLENLTRLACITTYGAPRWTVRYLIGDPNRKVLLRGIARLCHRNCRTWWLAQYGMNAADPDRLEAFRFRVARTLGAWGPV